MSGKRKIENTDIGAVIGDVNFADFAFGRKKFRSSKQKGDGLGFGS